MNVLGFGLKTLMIYRVPAHQSLALMGIVPGKHDNYNMEWAISLDLVRIADRAYRFDALSS